MDKVFLEPRIKQFEFDDAVASVFDDMLDRSIPFYKEVIDLIVDFLDSYLQDGATIVDLGCSTANTLLSIASRNNTFKLIGIDNSESMLKRASNKVSAYGAKIELQKSDIQEAELSISDAFIANYMFQFIRPLKRLELAKKIFNSLKKNGVFLISEKIIYSDKKIDKLIIDIYLSFKKKQGYSDFEIVQKREALENVLVPYTEEENKSLLKEAGFEDVQTIFKWGNFITMIAFKKS